MKVWKEGWMLPSLSLLSCSNLFCLINSFYPSGWSDSSRCAVRPTSQQSLLSYLSLSLSPSLSLNCISFPLSLSQPTCWVGPLSTRQRCSSEETERACRSHGDHNTASEFRTTAGRKKSQLWSKICFSAYFILCVQNTQKCRFESLKGQFKQNDKIHNFSHPLL